MQDVCVLSVLAVIGSLEMDVHARYEEPLMLKVLYCSHFRTKPDSGGFLVTDFAVITIRPL